MIAVGWVTQQIHGKRDKILMQLADSQSKRRKDRVLVGETMKQSGNSQLPNVSLVPALSIRSQGLIVVCMVILLEVVLFAAIFALMARVEHRSWRESHLKSMLMETNSLLKLFFDAGTSLAVYRTTHIEAFRQKCDDALAKIPQDIRTLRLLAQSDSADVAAEEHLEELAVRALQTIIRVRSSIYSNGDPIAADSFKSVHKEAQSILAKLTEEFERLASYEREQQAIASKEEFGARNMLKTGIVLTAAVQVLLAVGLSIAFAKRITDRIALLVDNTLRVLNKQELHPVVSGRDEIAYLDRAFHDMYRTLNDVERAKQEFVSTISHELRTPLSSVLGTLQLVRAGAYGELDGKGVRRLDHAASSVGRLITLINELLEIQKLEAGKLQMQFCSTTLAEVVESAVESVRSLAEAKEITLQQDLVAQAQVISADPARLEQVMINLLANAIRFSPEQGTITLATAKENEWLLVKISDQGPGIPASDLALIFEKFEQASNTSSMEGTGLGLPISKAIIVAHGGEIGVGSELGQGSTFWFKLPCKS